MCIYISIVLPPGPDTNALRKVLGTHFGGLYPAHMPHLQQYLPAGSRVYQHCDYVHCQCDSALREGNPPKTAQQDIEALAKKARKLKRQKGWSEEKATAYLEEIRRKMDIEAERKGRAGHAARAEELSRWHALIEDLLANASLQWVGVYLHMYSGRADDAEVITRTEQLSLQQVSIEHWPAFEEDVLYRFVQ